MPAVKRLPKPVNRFMVPGTVPPGVCGDIEPIQPGTAACRLRGLPRRNTLESPATKDGAGRLEALSVEPFSGANPTAIPFPVAIDVPLTVAGNTLGLDADIHGVVGGIVVQRDVFKEDSRSDFGGVHWRRVRFWSAGLL